MSSSESEPVSSSYDCSDLLQAVSNQESAFSDSVHADFGHPDTPTVRICFLGNLLLMVAFTPHFCYFQEQSNMCENVGDPMELCQFSQEEQITSLVIVSLQDENLLLDYDDEDERRGRGAPIQIETSEEFTPEQENTPNKSLLKGTMSSYLYLTRVAIVIGTTASRVYSVELRVDMLQSRVITDDNSLITCEVLPPDSPRAAEHFQYHGKTPFQPTGGVMSLTSFVNKQQETYVWIVYRDGCMVRIHSAALFPSIWQRGAFSGQSVDDILGRAAVLRCQVQVPSLREGEQRSIVPLVRSFPSLTQRLLAPRKKGNIGQNVNAKDSMSPELTLQDQEDEDVEIVQAIVFSSHATSPLMVFYSSEVQFQCDGKSVPTESQLVPDRALLQSVVGGTKALVGGVFGATLGIFGWGNHSNVDTQDPPTGSPSKYEPAETSMDVSMETDPSVMGPFPTLWNEPVKLFSYEEIHDSPRKFQDLLVEPGGQLGATVDNLGRVCLIDLSTRQIIRLFKGYRDASVYWIHSERRSATDGGKALLNLAIHSRQRRVLEVYGMRHGARIHIFQVDRDSEVLPSHSLSLSSRLSSAYLLKSRVPGTSMNQLEEIRFDPYNNSDTGASSNQIAKQAPSRRSTTLRLQHLRQLLSTAAVHFTSDDVLQTLKAISSLSDLAIALDLISQSSLLEDKLEVQGSSFHKLAIDHCSAVFDESAKNDSDMLLSNPVLSMFSKKVQYHKQLVEAYDIIFKFESSPSQSDGAGQLKDPSHWTVEALGWASVFEQVMGLQLADETSSLLRRARFSEFALACMYPNDGDEEHSKLKIYFSDSRRSRKDILIHVFKPLLGDAFSSSVTSATFDALGIRDDYSFISLCFGEWAMTLPVKEMCRTGLLSQKSPLNRFVQDLACRQLDDGNLTSDTALGDVYSFCRRTEDLLRAFIVAVLCRNGVEVASARKEKATYGKVLSSNLVEPWETLLRKIRIAILLQVKLKHIRLVAPITVANLEDGLFSIYELLAHDELSVTANHEEILALETACRGSPYAFDPFSVDGDDSTKVKQLHETCLLAPVDEQERSEYLIDFDDGERFGLLLLFFPMYNESSLLACHRARLLTHAWLKNPEDFKNLHDAYVTLRHLSQTCDLGRLVIAVSLEVWQSIICPVYRARLTGFHDAHEIDELLFAPLLATHNWMTQFGGLSLKVLELIMSIPWTDEGWGLIESNMIVKNQPKDMSWPSNQADHVLKGLVDKSRKVDATATAVHVSVVCSLNVSDDTDYLLECIPNFYDCFGTRSLYSPMIGSSDETMSSRAQFLEAAVVRQAEHFDGPPMESFELGDCTRLSQIWGMDTRYVHTLFLQLMYELGKDSIVDELTTKGTGSYDVGRFIDIGVDVVCLRLHSFLSGKAMQSPDMRGTIGLLDADLCEWIHQRAKFVHCHVAVPQLNVPIALTHLLALHLLSLSATSNIDPPLRVKIHSLTVSCGVLAKVTETGTQHNNR